ncbi:MAG: DUF3365 domain-containing protein [Rhodovibrionaceae bacterium]|nr:DUF3365 domain-containing protein [Rhodovibrionaceae bacterium]
MLRRMRVSLTFASALAAGLALSAPARAEPYAQEIETARALAQDFQKSLKSALMKAISEGGPQNAIGVCNVRAPQIAADLSQRSGWRVGRTALKVRNPGNAPSAREEAVLRSFQKSLAAGKDPKSLEAVAVVETGDGRSLHYMKAIPTGEVCTTCHGKDVDPELLATIRETYPQDEAVGFEAGELRGAFTFYKPLEAN